MLPLNKTSLALSRAQSRPVWRSTHSSGMFRGSRPLAALSPSQPPMQIVNRVHAEAQLRVDEGREQQGAPGEPKAPDDKNSEGKGVPGSGGPSPDPIPPLPPKMQYLVALLIQSAGVSGTAAVILGTIFHIDPFGNFNLNPQDCLLGISLFVPIFLVDLLIMWPSRLNPEDRKDTASVFLDASTRASLEKMAQAGAKVEPSRSTDEQAGKAAASGAALGEGKTVVDATASSTDPAASQVVSSTSLEVAPSVEAGAEHKVVAEAKAEASPAAAASTSTASSSSTTPSTRASRGNEGAEVMSTVSIFSTAGAGGMGEGDGISIFGKPGESKKGPDPELTGAALAYRQFMLALEILQGYYTRDNPTAIFHPATEVAFIFPVVLAEEMCYRGFGLIFVASWLTDRLYEAGADDVMSVMGQDMAPVDLGRWSTAVGAILIGALFYGYQTWQDMSTMNNVVKMMEAQQAEATKKRERLSTLERLNPKPQDAKPRRQVDGTALSQLPPNITQNLASKFGKQHIYVSVIQGLREVAHTGASCSAFLLTGNLAASFAGNVASQILFSFLQRKAASREVKRKKEALAKFVERRNKLLVQEIKQQLPPEADE